MIRVLLTWILPILLPTIVYFLWVAVARRRQTAGGPQMQDVPWTWLLAAGVALAAIVAVATLAISEYEIGRDYRPAYMDEQGRIVPGRHE